jgi:hypothetical protein
MTVRSITSGFQLATRRPGLTLLVYLANLFVALLLSIPVFSALSVATANSGYGPELVERFDFVLWADIIERAGDALLASWVQVAWAIPIALLWKVAMSVGLIHALRDGGIRSFWEGVGRFTGKALLMALLYLVLVVVWLVVVGIVIFVAAQVISRSPASFTLYWIVGPAAVVIGVAVFDLMHDFGRISLVTEDRGATAAWLDGIKYPFRHPAAIVLYGFWVLVALAVSAAAIRLHASWGATMASVWLLFLGQQVVFFVRSAATVAWFGSEVSFFERLRHREAPLIADVPAASGEFSVQGA